MNKIYIWASIGIIVLSVNIAKNFTGIHSYHAVYVYELIKNTNWPIEKKNGEFVIGVFGKTSILNELEQLAQNHYVGARKIKIKKLDSLEDVSDCNIAYMPGVEEEDMERINSISKANGVLVVTEGPEMSDKGGAVNFISNKGKLEYEIDESVAKEARLSFSSRLLAKGRVLH